MISIILRIKNEMPWLKYTLKMLAVQDRQDFELICVDSGSTDGGWELLQAKAPDLLYRIASEDYIPGKVLNDAISHAKGEYVVFNNADCIPLDSHWLSNLIRPLEKDAELVAVFANQIARRDADLLVRKDYERAFGDGRISAKWRHFFSLASSAVRRETILKHPFNPDLQYSEDVEWSWRMKQLGHRIVYVPDARVQHSHNYTLKDIRKRYRGEGKAEAYIYRDLYQSNTMDTSFVRTVLVAALMEFARDTLYLIKHGRPDLIPQAKIYRFAQRFYAFQGRKEGMEGYSRTKLAVSCLAFDDGKSGISDYTVNVVKELVKHEPLTLIIHPSDRDIFPIVQDNLSYYLVPEYLKRPILSMLWHLYCLPRLIKKNGWEKIFLPAANRRLLCRYQIPAALTFHDLSQFHIPGKYDFLRMLYIKHVVPYYLKKAPSVFAISESTKNDLIRYYGMKPELVTVNYNGFNPEKLNGDMTLEQLQERFGILKKYMLYIARVEHPGKNHLNLLKAYEQLPEEIKNEYELVCAGSKWSNSEAVISYHSGMKDRANIHFPGFVSGNDMAALYKNASLYVFPSLYEGFGLPLLEAFATGVPVVCSDRSSLPEIGADAVRCFNPDDPVDIASTIQGVLSDPPLMIQMIHLGKERLKDFSWEKHTTMIVESLSNQR